LGLLVKAGSHLRASPTRSYVAWASVATDERPSAPVSKTVPLPDLPRGGLVGDAIRLTCAGRCLCDLGHLCGGKIRQNKHDGRIITCGRAKSFSKAGIRAVGVSRGGDRSAGGCSCYICRPQGRHQWRLGCTRNGRRRQRWIRSQLARGLASVDVPRQVGVLSEHVPAHRNRGLDQPAHKARRWCEKGPHGLGMRCSTGPSRTTALRLAAGRVPPKKEHPSTAATASAVFGVGAVGGSPRGLRGRRPPRLASHVARVPDLGDARTAAACLGV